MHAASVHPEPGSNSLMFCIYTLLLPQKHIHQSDLFALLLVSSFFSSSKEFRSLCTSCASSCCSIFNEPLAALSSGHLVYYITSHSPCQYLFSNFFIPFFADFCIRAPLLYLYIYCSKSALPLTALEKFQFKCYNNSRQSSYILSQSAN